MGEGDVHGAVDGDPGADSVAGQPQPAHTRDVKQRRGSGQLGRPILSTLHAAFSFGALGGAAVGGLVAGAGVEVAPHLFAVAAAGVASILIAGRFLLPPGADATP